MTALDGRVLLLGLDGATWRVVEPLARQGLLPNLAGLMARGTHGLLRSTTPAVTLPAWSSLVTGKNPGKHGVFSFRRLAFEGYERRGLSSAADLHGSTLWDIVGRAGRPVGVINVPPSFPLRPVNGYVVSCLLTPPGEPHFTEPPEVAAELGEYCIDTEVPRDLVRTHPAFRERILGYVTALERQTQLRAAATVRMMRRRPWDLLAVVFYAPDRVQHFLWPEIARLAGIAGAVDGTADATLVPAVARLFRTVDAAVGELVASAGPDATVAVVSDHGAGPAPRWLVRVNRWLADHGFLHQHRAWKLRRRLVRSVLPRRLRERYDRPDRLLFNWSRTRAWAEVLDNPGTIGIWIHERGRFPFGRVAPGADSEAVRRAIVDGLRALCAPSGARVFAAVLRREELYQGPFAAAAPDVVAVCESEFGASWQPLTVELRQRALFAPFDPALYNHQAGQHTADGLYLFAGPRIRGLGACAAHPIEAVAPTVLHLLGLPVPRAMDGHVIAELLEPSDLAAHPVVFSDDLDDSGPAPGGWQSAEDESRVADHLRALGYLG
ncbi:MAG: alkaline phosphatase family protein [Candidatus Binatia bacterium]